jgi:hypothetical protein
LFNVNSQNILPSKVFKPRYVDVVRMSVSSPLAIPSRARQIYNAIKVSGTIVSFGYNDEYLMDYLKQLSVRPSKPTFIKTLLLKAMFDIHDSKSDYALIYSALLMRTIYRTCKWLRFDK